MGQPQSNLRRAHPLQHQPRDGDGGYAQKGGVEVVLGRLGRRRGGTTHQGSRHVFGPAATPLLTPTRGAAANGRGATATPAERGQVFCASKWIQVLLPRVPPDGGGTPAAVALHALLLVTAWSAFVEACVAAPPTRSGRRRAARRASAVGGSPGSAGCGGFAAASAGGPPPDDGSVEAGLLRASLNGGGGGSGEAVLLSEARLDMASRRELVAAMDEELAARRAPGGLWAATPAVSAVLGQTRNAIAAALGVDA